MSCGRCSASSVSAVSEPARLSNCPIWRDRRSVELCSSPSSGCLVCAAGVSPHLGSQRCGFVLQRAVEGGIGGAGGVACQQEGTVLITTPRSAKRLRGRPTAELACPHAPFGHWLAPESPALRPVPVRAGALGAAGLSPPGGSCNGPAELDPCMALVGQQRHLFRRSWLRRRTSSRACRRRSRRISGACCGSRCNKRVPTRRRSAVPCRRWSAACRRRRY